jgi:hypothetical protein
VTIKHQTRTLVYVELPPERFDFVDDLAQRSDSKGDWERKAWTESSYAYEFSDSADANFFYWLCAAHGLRPRMK